MKSTKQASRAQGQVSRRDNEMFGAELPRSLMPLKGNRFSFRQLVGPSYKVDLVSDVITINVASGAVANSTSIGNLPTTVRDWANKWAKCFEEYRLLGLRAVVRNVGASAGSGGVAAIWLDEFNSASPSSLDARSERHAELSLGNNVSSVTDQTVLELSWTPHDITDLPFISTSSGVPDPLYLKVYTDVANFGTSGTGQTNRLQVELIYRVLFRGTQ